MKCLYVHSWQYIYIYIYDYNLISILKKKKKGKRRKRKILSLSLSLSFSLSHSLYFYLWTIPPRAFSNAYHSYKNSTFLATWQSFSSSPLLPPQYQIVFITHLLHVHLSDPNAFVSRAIASLLLDSHLQPSPSTWDI